MVTTALYKELIQPLQLFVMRKRIEHSMLNVGTLARQLLTKFHEMYSLKVSLLVDQFILPISIPPILVATFVVLSPVTGKTHVQFFKNQAINMPLDNDFI